MMGMVKDEESAAKEWAGHALQGFVEHTAGTLHTKAAEEAPSFLAGGDGGTTAPTAAPTGSAPAIAVSPDGKTVYVATGQGSDSSVAVFSHAPSSAADGAVGALKFVELVHDPRSQHVAKQKDDAAEAEVRTGSTAIMHTPTTATTARVIATASSPEPDSRPAAPDRQPPHPTPARQTVYSLHWRAPGPAIPCPLRSGRWWWLSRTTNRSCSGHPRASAFGASQVPLSLAIVIPLRAAAPSPFPLLS